MSTQEGQNHVKYNGLIQLPQKDMMWLLSACTNFLVTASSMICFTYEAKVHSERPRLPDTLTERDSSITRRRSRATMGRESTTKEATWEKYQSI